MRDDHHRPSARDAEQVGVDQRFALRVERARGFVQKQDARVGNEGAGDRETLPLAAGQIGRALLDEGLVPVRHSLDEFFCAGEPRGADRVLERQPRPARDDVVANRAAKQEIVL